MANAIIIGGGAAGMFASIFLAEQGFSVTLIEKNEKLGKKLFITGKGRCNFTNDCTPSEFMENVTDNPKFLYSALSAFPPQKMIEQLNAWGLKTKVERGNRAFPESDHAYDVIDVLKKEMKKAGVNVILDTAVEKIIIRDGHVIGVRTDKKQYDGERVLVATGGLSYPATGSTGDGYRFAKETGHTVTELYPSLTAISCSDDFCEQLQGLSLKNVCLSVRRGKKEIFSDFGEMLFTHFGISGPLVLTASSKIGPLIGKEDLEAFIDLKPAVDEKKADAHFLRLFAENENRSVENAIRPYFPSSLVPVVLKCAGLEPEKKVHDITKEERASLISATKALPLHFSSLRGFEEAVVTKGGVSVKEIDPKTMESRLVKGLYFIGEVLDADALTGGFNLQIAWSTAYEAGNS